MPSYERFPPRVDSPSTYRPRVGSPQRSPRRRPPASPSRSLFGLERAVPPKASLEQLSYRSWDSTPDGSSTDVNKPLPHSPTRSRASSVYSGGSGYTKIIESYGSDEDVPPMPVILQPKAERDTVAGLLQHRDGFPWYEDIPKVQDRSLRASQSIPTLQYAPFRDERWNASAHELSQAPAFSEFRNRMHEPVSPISPGSWMHRSSSHDFLSPPLVSPPLVHPEYHLSLDHERHYLPGPMSASVTEIVDPRLVPQPLRMSKTASMLYESPKVRPLPSSESLVKHVELLDIKEAQRRAAEAKQRDLHARAEELISRKSNMRESSLIDLAEAQRRQAYEKLQRTSAPYEQQTEPRPRSVSSDSFVIYTGIREGVKAMIKQKLKQKKESREIEKAAKVQEKERKRVMSGGERKRSTTKTTPRASQDQPRTSGSSGRASLTEGVSSLFRNLSISKTQREEEANRGRHMERGRRPKQLAVPPSPYQKYGAEVWYAKNKKARKNLNLQAKSGGIQRAPTKKAGTRFVTKTDLGQRPALRKKRSDDVKEAYQFGASQLRTVLGVDDAKTAKSPKDKDKKSRKLGFGRTMSEIRRERLKRSIAVLGPAAQPVATQVDDGWV